MAVVAGIATDLETTNSYVLGTASASVVSKLINYGVKYRLDFGTNHGENRKWRLEILKDGYSSAVIDLVGQSNPVSITWDGGDAIETPILGSVCNLNLFQTSDYDISELYTPNEFEFFVKVYYESSPSTYSLFWKGFIVQDEYIEYIQSEPFPVNIKASDKIAFPEDEAFSLGGTTQTENITPHDIIRECIERTGLEFDYVDCTDMKTTSRANYNISSILSDHTMASGSLFGTGSNPTSISYKEALEAVCRSYNARIFQRFGRLFFVFVQSYASAAPIKSHEYTYLTGTWANADLTFRELDIKNDLKPLGRDFSRTSTAALKEYKRSYSAPPKNLIFNGSFELSDDGWTDDGNVTIETENTKVGENAAYSEITNVGTGTFNSASETVKNTTYRVLQTETVNVNASESWDHVFFNLDNTGAASEFTWLNGVFSFYYYIDEENVNGHTHTIRMSVERNSSPNYYYDLETGYLDKTVPFVYTEVTTETTRQWAKVEFPLRMEVPATGVGFTFRIHRTAVTGGASTTKMYFDDFQFKLTTFKSNQNQWSAQNQKVNYSVSKDSNTNSKTISEDCRFGVTEVEIINDALFSEYELGNKTLGQYYYDNALEKVDLNQKALVDGGYVANNLEEWALYSMCSIYSAPTQRYEGTMQDAQTSSSYIPINLLDKFTLGFATYSENAEMVLTRLTLNLKSNEHFCQWLTVEGIPNVSALDQTITRTYGS